MHIGTLYMKGYHGTTNFKADIIVAEQRFIQSSKDTEWLGKGVYFFCYKEHAVRWAKKKAEEVNINNPTCKPAVLSAIIDVSEEEILDLDDPEQLDAVNKAFKDFLDAGKAIDLEIAKKNGKKVQYEQWCLACMIYCDLYPEIKVITYTFSQRKQDNKDAFRQTEKQICVREELVIKDICLEDFL